MYSELNLQESLHSPIAANNCWRWYLASDLPLLCYIRYAVIQHLGWRTHLRPNWVRRIHRLSCSGLHPGLESRHDSPAVVRSRSFLLRQYLSSLFSLNQRAWRWHDALAERRRFTRGTPAEHGIVLHNGGDIPPIPGALAIVNSWITRQLAAISWRVHRV